MQMATITEEDMKEAKIFTDFYTDLIENHLNSVEFYLSECAALDWFGKTIKGEKNVSAFLKNNASNIKHLITDPNPATKIGFRDTHVIKYPKEQRKRSLTFSKCPIVTTEERTPPNDLAGSSKLLEQGQGDGLHNCDLLPSPAKRCRIDDNIIVCEENPVYSPVKYITTDGHLEFHKRSTKRFQRGTKWQRPCKLEVAYSMTNITDVTIHLIIYSCEMKCKRNLLKEFDSSATAD